MAWSVGFAWIWGPETLKTVANAFWYVRTYTRAYPRKRHLYPSVPPQPPTHRGKCPTPVLYTPRKMSHPIQPTPAPPPSPPTYPEGAPRTAWIWGPVTLKAFANILWYLGVHIWSQASPIQCVTNIRFSGILSLFFSHLSKLSSRSSHSSWRHT